MLEVKNLNKTFDACSATGARSTVAAVKNVDFTLKKGDFCVLVGESGSGKSTLARMLTGLISPTSGDVLLDGKPILSRRNKRDKAICSRIQLVLQDGKSALDPHMSIYECIAEPIHNLTRLTRQGERHRILNLITQMELPQELLSRRPAELSGGQQKRVCIARALAAQPEIIIFDEAVSGLDVIVRKNILDLLVRLHAQLNTAYLFITHDMDVALYLADTVLVMKEGEIIERVRYQGDLSCFSHPYSKLLLDAMLPAKCSCKAAIKF